MGQMGSQGSSRLSPRSPGAVWVCHVKNTLKNKVTFLKTHGGQNL